LCLLSIAAQAQPADTLKVRNKFIPTGIRVGADLITPIKGYRSENFNGWEVNADVDIYRYFLAMDYGRWATMEPLKNGYYDNGGKYFRFGVDVNFLKKDPDRNMFFLGFRIGRSSFSDSIAYSYGDEYYTTVTKNLVNTNLVGHWTELTTGLRVRIWKYFWMGYTARMKFSPSVDGNEELTTFDIPGYGLASRKLYWGFNYQLFFRIPFVSEKIPKKKK
jgi:Domain of unknown function (DUF6048)